MAQTEVDFEAWLRTYLQRHGGVAGTLHMRGAEHLELKAAVNIPQSVIEVVRSIPIGKGMAGLAWERDEPVHTCNLRDDASGKVRPGAKAVDADAAVALPIHYPQGEVRGVVGIAYLGQHDITQRELRTLSEQAERLPE